MDSLRIRSGVSAPHLLRGGEFSTDFLPITPASWPVLARQYSNPRTRVLEYLHVGTAVLARVDYRDTVPKESSIRVVLSALANIFANLFACKGKKL